MLYSSGPGTISFFRPGLPRGLRRANYFQGVGGTGAEPFFHGVGGTGADPFFQGVGGTGAEPFRQGVGGTGADPLAIITELSP
jgi:hypothetical protein